MMVAVAGYAEYGQKIDTDDHGMFIAPLPYKPIAAL